MSKSIIFGCTVLYVVVQLSSCVTQQNKPRRVSKAEKIMRCVEYFGNEDADFMEKMDACTNIYERKTSGNLKE